MLTSRHVIIRNQASEMPRVSAAIDALAAQQAWPERILMQVQVAVDEIVSNVIKYAWPEGGAHEISIDLCADETRITVEVVDDGRGFDPSIARAPAQSAPARPGGRGLDITRQLVDDIAYHRRDGRNRTTIVKHLR